MNKEQIVGALRNKAKEDKVSNAIFHMFALRDRSRSDITIIGLSQAMKHEGFQFKREDYQSFLKFLSSLEIGELMYDEKRRVRGIKNIQLTLESIGKAAISAQENNLDKFTPRKKFNDLIIPKEVKVKSPDTKVEVSLVISGKAFSLNLPDNLSNSEIAAVLNQIRGKKSE